MLKTLFFFLIIFFYSQSNLFGQIIDVDEVEETPKAQNDESYLKTDGEIYFGILPKYSYREMAINEDFVTGSIEEFEAEEGKVVSNFMFGYRMPLAKSFFLDLGIGFYRNRDFYRFEDIDTLYQYTNTYRHISFPFKFNFKFGDRISLITGVGITPKALINMKSEITFRDSFSSFEQEEELVTREGYNLFVVDASANIGVRVEVNDDFGFHILAEGDYQLNNTFDKMSTIIRNAYTIGGSLGLTFRINQD